MGAIGKCCEESGCPGLVIPQEMTVNIGSESHVVEAASWVMISECCARVEILLSDTWHTLISDIVAAYSYQYEYDKDHMHVILPVQDGGPTPDPNCATPFACLTIHRQFKQERVSKIYAKWRRKKITFYLAATNVTCAPDPTEPAPMVLTSRLDLEYKYTQTPTQHNINRCTTTHEEECCHGFDINVETTVTEASILAGLDGLTPLTFYAMREQIVSAINGTYNWTEATQINPECEVDTPCIDETDDGANVEIASSDPNYDPSTYVDGDLIDNNVNHECRIWWRTDAGAGLRWYYYWDGTTVQTLNCKRPRIKRLDGVWVNLFLSEESQCRDLTDYGEPCFMPTGWRWPPGGPPLVARQKEPICMSARDMVFTHSRTAYTPRTLTIGAGTWSTSIVW